MIDGKHGLPLKRQAEVLKLSRSSLYYRPRPVSESDLAIMRRLDQLHLDFPFAGSRMLRDFLRAEGVKIGRCRVITLMRRMGIEALYRRPNTSKPAPGHQIFPYLLRGKTIDRPNQVWAMDITLYGAFVVKRSVSSSPPCVLPSVGASRRRSGEHSRSTRSQWREAVFSPRSEGSSPPGAIIAPRPCIRWALMARTMMQPCASTARFRVVAHSTFRHSMPS